jgi:signal transduction histidine kinase
MAVGIAHSDRMKPAVAWPGMVVDRAVRAIGQGRRWSSLVWAGGVAALCAAGVVFARVPHGGMPVAVALGFAVIATAPLLMLRRRPLLALAPVVLANAAASVVLGTSWPVAAQVAWMLALLVAPIVLRRGPASALLVISEVGLAAAAVARHDRPGWLVLLLLAIILLVAWGVGESWRARREGAAQAQRTAAQLRHAREQEGAAQARTAIARELHDVVAHAVSLIAVRASTAPYQLADLSPAARSAFEEIAAQARGAMSELRVVLGVLRSDEAVGVQAPLPTLDDLPDLVARMRTSGMIVTLDHSGGQVDLGAAEQLCAFRVVQEALTNAARHAPGAPVDISLRRSGRRLIVRIANPVRTLSGQDGARASDLVGEDAGYGLIGMRERVSALGGTLQVTHTRDEFVAQIELPIGSGT